MDQRLKRVKLTILPKLIHEFNAFKSVLNRRLLAKTKVAEKKKEAHGCFYDMTARCSGSRQPDCPSRARKQGQRHRPTPAYSRAVHATTATEQLRIGAKMNLQPYFTPYTNFD